MDDSTVTRFGRYEVLEKLGQGAMGVVYRARDPVLGRMVALKVISAGFDAQDDAVRRFQREAQSAARLNHPNIVQVYDFGSEDGQLYITMELLGGSDLREMISNRVPLTLDERVRILLQVARALGYAHSRGVIHRDIKPGNVVVASGGLVKLMDFGLARLDSNTVTRPGVILGTPDYMSPEQARGQNLDHRSDIFSAGCLFYEFLTSRKPFPGDTLHAVLFRIIEADPEPVRTLAPQVPPALADLVQRMMAKSPDDRPQSMADVADGLERFAPQPVGDEGAEAVSALPPSSPRPDDDTQAAKNRAPVRAMETLQPGMMVAGRYELLAALGRGSTGTVYKALDRVLEEEIAIKVLHADVAATPELARRFRLEIRLARRVSHRNVCRIHEYGEDQGRVFISMELVEGESLKRLIGTHGRVPAPEALDIAIQAAKGLAAIHEAGIVHRDLKPANVMRDGRGTVKLMDFGVAKVVGAVATEAGVAGTPAYMSPEQVLGQEVDARSDVYSLGTVLYELFTGRLPIRALDPSVSMFRRVQEEFRLDEETAASLPGPVVPILTRALRKEPAERFASAVELLEALRAARNAGERPGQDVDDRHSPRPMADVTGLTSLLRAAVPQPRISRTGLSKPAQAYKVFIAYRRDDSADIAGRIHDRMAAALGRASVFKDVDSIPLGANYRDYLENAVKDCLVLVAVVGKGWLDARDQKGRRRLEDPRDWVRIEIEAALRLDIPVIPLFVHGATMPDETELPSGLERFATQSGAAIRSDSHFDSDVKRLIGALKKLFDDQARTPGASPEA